MNPFEPPAVMDSKQAEHPIEVFRSSLAVSLLFGLVGVATTHPIVLLIISFDNTVTLNIPAVLAAIVLHVLVVSALMALLVTCGRCPTKAPTLWKLSACSAISCAE